MTNDDDSTSDNRAVLEETGYSLDLLAERVRLKIQAHQRRQMADAQQTKLIP